MSYFRSYFLKNNTIISNTLTNTAKNPATNIFYGVNHSRFLFQVDFSNLTNKIQNGELVLDSNTTHTLSLKNTIFGDETLLNLPTGAGMDRASSFELILFVIPEYWDEGAFFVGVWNDGESRVFSPENAPDDMAHLVANFSPEPDEYGDTTTEDVKP
jgi:hypothetical protein